VAAQLRTLLAAQVVAPALAALPWLQGKLRVL